MIDLRKIRDIHPHLLRSHGDDINKPPQSGHERFGLQNANGIAKGRDLEGLDVIFAAESLHLGVFGITEPNLAMTIERKNLINVRVQNHFG